jgi:regulator of protease activity HflC (stomatin/prohibitin superfamily)
MKESTDVGTAQEKLTAAQEEAAALEAELEAQIADLAPPAPPLPEVVRLKLVPATLRIDSAGILWTA